MGAQSSPGRVLGNPAPRDRIGQCCPVGKDARLIHPCRMEQIDSVKINPSLVMMRECFMYWDGIDFWVLVPHWSKDYSLAFPFLTRHSTSLQFKYCDCIFHYFIGLYSWLFGQSPALQSWYNPHPTIIHKTIHPCLNHKMIHLMIVCRTLIWFRQIVPTSYGCLTLWLFHIL